MFYEFCDPKKSRLKWNCLKNVRRPGSGLQTGSKPAITMDFGLYLSHSCVLNHFTVITSINNLQQPDNHKTQAFTMRVETKTKSKKTTSGRWQGIHLHQWELIYQWVVELPRVILSTDDFGICSGTLIKDEKSMATGQWLPWADQASKMEHDWLLSLWITLSLA